MECVYPFGVDPAWALSPQLLTFTNNIKMKLAVIIGVIHMTIGIIVKGTNSVYFGKNLDLFFEVITGLIILLGLFGWMDFLIFSKWTYEMNPYSNYAPMIEKITLAPSIITVMINNFLAGGYPSGKSTPTNPIEQQYFVPG
jgi:V-type H+-transporting ATPase subunit a